MPASKNNYIKAFNQFKMITDSARSTVSSMIHPMLEGAKLKGEYDEILAEHYNDWKAAARAAAAAVERPLYPNEMMPMPAMPVDDIEHTPCRQMAAVLIERTIYDEHIASRWFQAAADAILANPACANHSKKCACKAALKGWSYMPNKDTVNQLVNFYAEHYMEEKDEDYVAEIRSIANARGVPFEEEMERARKQKADLERCEALELAKKAAKAEKLKDCVFICYQDVHDKYAKYNKDYIMHGWFRIVKTSKGYEFTIVDTGGMEHPSWHIAVANKQVWHFPLEVAMGVKGDTFENVTPDKIHMG